MSNRDLVIECIGDHRQSNRNIFMGVDQGRKNHVEITEYFENRRRASVLLQTKVDSWADLSDYIDYFNVRACVIDADPQLGAAKALAQSAPGIVTLCRFRRGLEGPDVVKVDNGTIAISRPYWVREALRRFTMGWITLPVDVSEEYLDDITTALDNNEGPAHFSYARVYCELAHKLYTESL